MSRRIPVGRLLLGVGVAACQAPTPEAGSQSEDELAATKPTIFQATLGEVNAETLEIATEELLAALAEGDAVLLDTRPHQEWATSHIPGAENVAPKPGVSMAFTSPSVA